MTHNAARATNALLASLILAASPAWAQSVEPRQKPADYPACQPNFPTLASPAAATSSVTVCADFLGHSVPVASGVEFAPHHIVLELGFLGPVTPIQLASGRWSISINGSKSRIPSDSPSSVATTILYPDYDGRGMTAAGGVGNSGVILGAPSRRYPPDIDQRRGGPPIPRAPQPTDRAGASTNPQTPESLREQLQKSQLPEGEARTPVAGLLFFTHEGKLAKIKTLDLYYQPASPDATPIVIRVRPASNPSSR